MPQTNPKVDGYIRKNKTWQAELEALRAIVLAMPLVEEVKWRAPCYTYEGSNVAFVGCLKNCCTLSFIKGALLKDTKGILEKPGPNTQSARVIRFNNVQEITKLTPALKAYLKEAIALEKAGAKMPFKKTPEPTPAELQAKFDDDPAFHKAFTALTPGRQRAYILHISSAKQSKTRTARIEKWLPHILDGKGLHD